MVEFTVGGNTFELNTETFLEHFAQTSSVLGAWRVNFGEQVFEDLLELSGVDPSFLTGKLLFERLEDALDFVVNKIEDYLDDGNFGEAAILTSKVNALMDHLYAMYHITDEGGLEFFIDLDKVDDEVVAAVIMGLGKDEGKTITVLNLQGTSVTGDVFKTLADLPNLERLNLCDTSVVSFESLEQLGSLKNLIFTGVRIEDYDPLHVGEYKEVLEAALAPQDEISV